MNPNHYRCIVFSSSSQYIQSNTWWFFKHKIVLSAPITTLNIRAGCYANNPREIVLSNLGNERHINILTLPGPINTYWLTSPNNNPDILEIFAAKISSNLHYSSNNILLIILNSDPSSVLLTIFATPLVRAELPNLSSPQTVRKKFYNIIN